MPNSIALIIPALNEESVLLKVLDDIYSSTFGFFDQVELILINDGSVDSTGQIMNKFAEMHPNTRVIHNPKNRGLGASFQIGLKYASSEYVMLLCGDGGLPAQSLPTIFSEVGNADLIIPYMVNLKKIKSKQRYFLSRTYVFLLNVISGFNLHYYNGLPIYRRAFFEEMTVKSSGFGFQGEILVKLLKSGCTFKEVGVEGAEETGKSDALRIRNILSVARTFARLSIELISFKPISTRAIERARQIKSLN